MAVVVTDRRTTVSEADDTTGWNTGTAVTDFFAEATACVAVALNTATGQTYFTSAARNLADTLIYVYSFNNALQANWDAASPPNALHLGDGTNRVSVRMAGGNRRVFAHSDGPTEWQCLCVDGARLSALNSAGLVVARAGSFGALNAGAITQLGADHTTLTKALGGGYNTAVDIIRVGNDGLRVTGGTTGDRGNLLEIAVEDRSTANLKAHGLLRELATGVFGCQGPITWGGPTETAWFEMVGQVLAFEGANYVGDDKFYLGVEGGSGATHVFIRECTIATAGPGVEIRFNIGAANINALEVIGNAFSGLKRAVLFGANSAHIVRGNSFIGCGMVDPGTTIFEDNTLQGGVDPLGAMLLDSDGTANISDLTFISGDTGHGVYITSPGTYDFQGWRFTGYGAGGSTDAAVYNNSGGSVTINVSGGGDIPTVRNGTGASTTVVAASQLTLTGLRSDGPASGTTVRVFETGTGNLLASGFVTTGTFNASIDAGEYPAVDVAILALGFLNIRLTNVSVAADVTIPIQQVIDRQYDNPA